MKFLRTHYEEHSYGSQEAKDAWKREGLIPDKIKFCDGLMLAKGREFDFTSDTDSVDCKKCQKKIEAWLINGFDLPH
jgi:hypothetical protein